MSQLSASSLNYKTQVFTIVKEKTVLLLLGMTVFFTTLLAIVTIALIKSDTKNVKMTEKNSQKSLNTIPTVKTYIVKEGDNLSQIADDNYGSDAAVETIIKANSLVYPDLLEPGQKLVLPLINNLQKKVLGETSSISTSKVTYLKDNYIVKEGDNLSSIALQAYGDSYAWIRIANANNLSDPNAISPGDTLKIPRN